MRRQKHPQAKLWVHCGSDAFREAVYLNSFRAIEVRSSGLLTQSMLYLYKYQKVVGFISICVLATYIAPAQLSAKMPNNRARASYLERVC